uniref:Uncharacterized protein n=1 Tax=Anguilla anguilla TaxID=7936 RepID=A0A0E9R391_ANGAN
MSRIDTVQSFYKSIISYFCTLIKISAVQADERVVS